MAPASFDVVTLWATLEHLAFPGVFLDAAHRVLRPYGSVLVTVPNGKALTCRILGRRNRAVCVEHLTYFTAGNLCRLLSDHGFDVDLVLTRMINPKTIVQDLLNRTGAPPGDRPHPMGSRHRRARSRPGRHG